MKLRSVPRRAHHPRRALPLRRAGAAARRATARRTSRSSVGDMGTVLDHTDLLVTVSSTAAAEAIHRGVPDRAAHRLRHPGVARQRLLPRLGLPGVLRRPGRRRRAAGRRRAGPGATASAPSVDRLPATGRGAARRAPAATAAALLHRGQRPGAAARPAGPATASRADGRPLDDGDGRPGVAADGRAHQRPHHVPPGANVVAPALRKLAAL